ncbi:MAG: hypothetical protein KBG28_06625 [Kofleriaceae bacterium]|nr:hypothetical protein [Kofleriaceae bacterium]MBP9203616.1 hypothetical protein [Kofleriaceae bacterium]
MDAAPTGSAPSGGATASAPAPVAKLTIDKFADAGIVCLRFTGTIDEAFEGKKLAAALKADTLVLDLGRVGKISSFGIREWVDFISAASRAVGRSYLIECAPKVVDQMNMVANFCGDGRVFSFFAPFRCDHCDSEHRVLLQVDRDWETIKSGKLAERPCPGCSERMYFDEDPTSFFSYILGQDRTELPAEVAAFLAQQLDYAVADLGRKLKVDKAIDGRVTVLKLAGDLDGTFPKDKLAEGLEGTVALDVAGLGRIEPAGAAHWRAWIRQVTPVVDGVYLLGAGPAVLERLAQRDDLGAKAQVVTASLPFTCAPCASTSTQLLDLAEHAAALAAGVVPERPCPTCKKPMTCVASDGARAALLQLPAVSLDPASRKIIDELRARRPEVRKAAAGAVVAPVVVARTSWTGPVLAALLALALAGGGVLAYQQLRGTPGPAGLRKAIAASASTRPGWIPARPDGEAGPGPGGGACADAGASVVCLGTSAIAITQDDADQDATEAALEALAGAVADRVKSTRWRSTVLPLWTEVRAAKLAAFAGAPDSAVARSEVREARRAVAAALRAAGLDLAAAPIERYWEEYDTTAGRRYLGFSQVTVTSAQLQRMAEAFGTEHQALGASAVGLFPLVGWRYPNVRTGVVLVAVEDGLLKSAGLPVSAVVVGVGGRPVDDGPAFVRVAAAEVAYLESKPTGGPLTLTIQGGDGRERTFYAVIAGKPRPPTGSGGGKRDGGGPRGGGPGNVNVWDRYDPKGRPGRDDPTQ